MDRQYIHTHIHSCIFKVWSILPYLFFSFYFSLYNLETASQSPSCISSSSSSSSQTSSSPATHSQISCSINANQCKRKIQHFTTLSQRQIVSVSGWLKAWKYINRNTAVSLGCIASIPFMFEKWPFNTSETPQLKLMYYFVYHTDPLGQVFHCLR